MQEINVEEIMREIREEIKSKGMEKQTLQFADVSLAEDAFEIPEHYNENLMRKELVNINGLWDTTMDTQVLSRGKLKKAVKKVLRKAVSVVVQQHIEEQVVFNASVVNSINMLHCIAAENEELKKEVVQLKQEVEQLKKMEG